jgi:hypothetical protein
MMIRILITAKITSVQDNDYYYYYYYYYFYIDPLNFSSIVYDKGAKTKNYQHFHKNLAKKN